MTIREESQILEPGSEIVTYVLDATPINVAAGIIRFHGHAKEGVIVWQGNTYNPWPIEAKGFEKTGGKPPVPTLNVGNQDGTITLMCLLYEDLVGSVLTRKRTLSKYLDAVNFPGGVNATANSAEQYPDEVWYIERKSMETHAAVTFELSSAMDFNGKVLPGRIITANQCYWQYRSPECGYVGGPVAKLDDTATSSSALDNCGKRPASCKIRFGVNAELPYGGFPGSGLMR